MPTIMRRRSLVSLLAVVAMVAGLLVIPVTAGAAVVDTSATCPSSIPAAGFTDIAGVQADAQSAINCIAFYKITTGTTATTYSPNNQVTRWQMALFLARQAGVHGVTLPATPVGGGFTDLTGVQADAVTAINQLFDAGVVKGTTATTFNPNGIVNRWQMALFLSRLVTAAGVTLPATPVGGGFTDLTGVQADAVTAINQLFDVGITTGTTATTFNPNGNVNRWQMALFLARTAAADNVRPSGLGNVVTAVDVPGKKLTYADKALAKAVTVTLKATGETYSVDGAAASQAALLLQASVGDLLSISGSAFALTNQTYKDYQSGPIGNIDEVARTFNIVEPITGTAMPAQAAVWDYDLNAFIVITSDGSAVSAAAADLDVSIGDSVVITGTGADAAHIRTFAFTNGSVTGKVSDVDGGAPGNFNISPWTLPADDINAVATDALTVDGAVETDVNFEADLSNGDGVTYSKKGGKQTIALTNAAAAAVSGSVLDFTTLTDTVVFDSGPAVAETEVYTGAVWIVDGVIEDEAGFEGDLSVGDTISYQEADGVSVLVDRFTLTNKGLSGAPSLARAGGLLFLEFDSNGPATVGIDYTSTAPAKTDLTGTDVKWAVNSATPANTAAAATAFEAAYDAVIAGSFDGVVTLTKVGNDLIWTITTS